MIEATQSPHPILVVLPTLSFLVALLAFHARALSAGEASPFRSFALTAAVWGLIVALSSELLSLFEGLSWASLAVTWAATIAVLGYWGGGTPALRTSFDDLVAKARPLGRMEWLVACSLLLIAATTFLIGWLSPPNNVDSLLYHMVRVANWVQNGSLHHAATKYHNVLNRPPWSEMAMMHLYLLWGGDRPVKWVQWFSMVGSVLLVAGIAGRLGAGRNGRWAAAALAASTPMGILQASSTQNDYVVAFWLAATLFFVVDGATQDSTKNGDLWVGLSAGLGMMSKATFYVYLVPVLAYWVGMRLWRDRLPGLVSSMVVVGMMILALNFGFWARNVGTYGSPLGGIRNLRGQLPDIGMPSPFPDSIAQDRQLGEAIGSRGEQAASAREFWIASQVIGVSRPLNPVERAPTQPGDLGMKLLAWVSDHSRKAISEILLHTVTPSSAVNEWIEHGLRPLSGVLHELYFEQRNGIAWNHEDSAGNPHHLASIAVALIVLLYTRRKGRRRSLLLGYTASVLLGYGMLTAFGNEPLYISLRYHLGFFVAAAPLMGVAAERTSLRWAWFGLSSALLTASLPWLLLNNTRPLIGMEPWPTRIGSVFTERKERIVFANIQPHMDDARAVTRAIENLGCTRVGLRLDSSDPEYQLWWLLGAPVSGIEIRSVFTYVELEHMLDPTFEPCAIICTICTGRSELDGLPVYLETNYYDLYASDP